MMKRPTALYDSAGVRALDDRAIRVHGIPGRTLMERAGHAAYGVLRRTWPDARRLAIFCGSGNNGGDGFVVASLAAREGLQVLVVPVGEPRTVEAKGARDVALSAGASMVTGSDSGLAECDLVVDAVFGTGLSRAPEGPAADAISWINGIGAPCFSLDMPSGLDADTGHAPGVAVKADATSTFIGLKFGLFTGVGPDLAGTLHFHDLDVPHDPESGIPGVAERIVAQRVSNWLPRRARCTHKGLQGRVVLAGGNRGMSGALRIACEAAARSGAGLVTAATRADHAAVMNAGQPEIMVATIDLMEEFDALLEGRDVLAIGPGLGRDEWARGLMERAIECALPMVVDADGLNILAGTKYRSPHWVLTPHPAEAARLLGCGTGDVEADRIRAVRAISERHGGVCVLKGCGTVVYGGDSLYLCDRGNPGMASGGMGDCLTGVIAALLGQGLDPVRAAVCAVWLHARAADMEAAANGAVGMLATDLFPWLRRLMETPVD